MTQHRTLLLGPPGTGKTERLLEIAERALERGVPADRIAFVSFTRAAVREARERAMVKFGLTRDDLPWWRTIHSLCFRQLGLRRGDVFGREDLRALSELTGEELTGHSDLDAPTLGDRGDALLFLDQAARSRRVPLADEWARHGGTVDRWRLDRFVAAYASMRADVGKLDFTDLLEEYVGCGPGAVDRSRVREPVPVDVAIIDEAQDLAPIGWEAVKWAFAGAAEVYVAGDDDQTLYEWAGADPLPLIRFDGERRVLGKSFRLPRAVHAVADRVAKRMIVRNDKPFAPRDEAGSVDWVRSPDHADVSAGTWLLLARTRRQLGELADLARSRGCHYSVMGVPAADPKDVGLILAWETLRKGGRVSASAAENLRSAKALPPGQPIESADVGPGDVGFPRDPLPWWEAIRGVPAADRDYLRACLRRGEKIAREPRVRVSTVHGAKGAEAESVLVVTDVPRKVWRGMEIDPDSERRVAYVAVTRASSALLLVEPRTTRAWEI